MRSGSPTVWSEWRWVRKSRFSFLGARPSTPLSRAAEARRTTPAPASTRYGAPFTTMARAEPHRSGSALGVPVPRRTNWVMSEGGGGAGSCPHARCPGRIVATRKTMRRAGPGRETVEVLMEEGPPVPGVKECVPVAKLKPNRGPRRKNRTREVWGPGCRKRFSRIHSRPRLH